MIIRPAPLILFVYKRPEITLRTIQKLKQNLLAKSTELFVFADGAKRNASSEDLRNIHYTRDLIQKIDGFSNIHITVSPENKGLRKSIIEGVTQVLEMHNQVIVVEDDLITSPFFLTFMNEALEMYKDTNVMSIGACNFFSTDFFTPELCFVSVPDCLGWATWKEKWKLYNDDSLYLLKELSDMGLMNKFNMFGAYDFEGLLKKNIRGEVSSWAINWYAVSVLTNHLNLYSKYSFTDHIGTDSNATHETKTQYSRYLIIPDKPVNVKSRPIKESAWVNRNLYWGYNNQAQGFIYSNRYQEGFHKMLNKSRRFLRYLLDSKNKTGLKSVNND